MEPFKNLLGPTAATRIALAIKRAHPRFNREAFFDGLERELAPLEFKARALLLAQRLHAGLPDDPVRAFTILEGALKQSSDDDVGLSGFEVWPLTELVAAHGLNHFTASMQALRAMTKVFTAEFAIRPFFLHHESETLAQLERWTDDDSEHVRRLVSEGSRPLLPWGLKLTAFAQDPKKTWPFLEALKDDPSVYVRKSVANHINDHTKLHGDWVVRQLKPWLKESQGLEERRWIVRHGLRTLIKRGHGEALKLQGVRHDAIRVVRRRLLTPRLKLGDKLCVEVTVKNVSRKEALVILDHELTLKGAGDKARSKVMKGKSFHLAAGETRTVPLSLTIKAVTTRRYYAGTQAWHAIVNGVATKPLSFELAIPAGR